jgi:hypothetical protein
VNACDMIKGRPAIFNRTSSNHRQVTARPEATGGL